MPIDPKYFRDFNYLEIGDTVQFRSEGMTDFRRARVDMIWFGIEECCTVIDDEGKQHYLYVSLGDEVKPMQTIVERLQRVIGD